MKTIPVFLLSIFIYCIPASAQVNSLGKPGYISIPSGGWFEDTDVGVSFAYIPEEYASDILASGNIDPSLNSLNFYSVRASLTSFFDVNFSVAYRPEIKDRIGIGDRQLDFRFRIKKEDKYWPSIVIGITPPGSRSPVLSHDYLVITKNFNPNLGKFQMSLGYGSPFVLYRDPQDDNNFWKSLQFRKKDEFRNNRYLSGIFGGVSYMPVDFAGIMAEYNTNTMNTGVFLKLDKRFYLQAYTFDFEQLGFSFSANFPLNLAPKTLRSYDGKN